MKWLLRLAKRLFYLPLSPRAFAACTSLMRLLGLLPALAGPNNISIRRILIAHLDGNIGDLILALPLMERLHKKWPDALLDIAVKVRGADFLMELPFVRNVFTIPITRTSFPGSTFYRRVLDIVIAYKRNLAVHQYDLAIAPRWGKDPFFSAYLIYLSGASTRIGFSDSSVLQGQRNDRLLTYAATGGDLIHEILRNLKVLQGLGVEPNCQDQGVVSSTIPSLFAIATGGFSPMLHGLLSERRGATGKPYVVISPGATSAFRLWPTEFWKKLLCDLNDWLAVDFYIAGSSNERSYCEEIAKGVGFAAVTLAGQTTIRELAALISGAELFVGSDSGPGHIAGGLGISTLIISPFPMSCKEEHHNSPMRFRPAGPRVKVMQPAEPLPPCAPTCNQPFSHCIRQIPVEEALREIRLLWAQPMGISSRD